MSETSAGTLEYMARLLLDSPSEERYHDWANRKLADLTTPDEDSMIVESWYNDLMEEVEDEHEAS